MTLSFLRPASGSRSIPAVRSALLVSCAALSCLASTQAQSPITAQHKFPVQGPRPGKYKTQRAFPNLSFVKPVFLTHAPDASNRIFVLEQDGVVSVFANDPNVSSRSIFLDLRGQVRVGGEQGLLGMAFDPNYASNGHFYLHYMPVGGARRSRIARYTVSANDPNKADPASLRILLEETQPYTNHNAGMLAFGPDDMLYIGMGDGGSGGDPLNHGQNRTTLLGNLLRIDPHGKTGSLNYGIPRDNPFVGVGGGVREEIWAYGLRNPWRFSFDPADGQLWLADVGQNLLEEVNLIRKGGNYGWRIREGNRDYSNPQNLPPSLFDEPIAVYDRSLARSIIGGYVYRGQRLPELQGAYIHGDYVTGNVWAMVEQNGKLVSNTLLGRLASKLSSFGVDQNGELYLVELGGQIKVLERDSSSPPQFPLTLSATGLFNNLQSLSPAPGVYPYEVNHPFWSDHAIKQRWLAYPGSPIGFSAKGPWSHAKGSVLVKHMEIEMREGDPSSRRRLETRVMIHEQDGWAGYTYRWNSSGTDANLVTHLGESEQLRILDRTGTRTVRVQDWRYPSRNECMQCHTQAAGWTLSTRTRQLNRLVGTGSSAREQLEDWDGLGMFASPVGKASSYERFSERNEIGISLERHARTWLDVNCAMCHQPGGGTPSSMDLRYDIPLAQTQTLDVQPSSGNLGLRDPRILKAHERDASVLLERIRRLGPARMPSVGSNAVDEWAVSMLGDWIGAPFEPFGQSCGGSAATPALQQAAGQEPRIGSQLGLELVQLPTDEGPSCSLASAPRAGAPCRSRSP
jgi:uncharacterized repeat protein (TIGR03806 family)